MRNVQSPPPLVTPVPDDGSVKPAHRVAAAAAVRERTLPPVVYRPRGPTPPWPGISRQRVPRTTGPAGDRRRLCRRLIEQPVLLELRSGPDRRHHCQREGDITTAIDEKI